MTQRGDRLTWLRRLFGRRPQASSDIDMSEAMPVLDEDQFELEPDESDEFGLDDAAALEAAGCPYCAYVIQPGPRRTRLCPSCRRRINVRRIEGRSVLLTDDAVPVFDRERQRAADELRWTAERKRWLGLAALLRAPADQVARLAAADLTESAVADSQALYMANAERAVRAARRAKRWPEVGRLRRQQAAELYNDAGAPIPPPEALVALHRDGMLAELRALSSVSTSAELVSIRCCLACRADDEKIFLIAKELRSPRLPHDGCPKGLCGCQWWLAMPAAKTKRRSRRSAVRSGAVAAKANDFRTPVETASPVDEAHQSVEEGLD